MANKNTKESTRDRIINSAKKLFAEQGYQKTTVMDISKQNPMGKLHGKEKEVNYIG